MADIFISYAHTDRIIAEALAQELREHGYRVWWDAELVGSDDFYEVILQALHDAHAVIVVWTNSSIKSRFVRDEAGLALHLNKLITVKEEALDPFKIPLGYRGQHADDVNDRRQIIKAIKKLGVLPNHSKQSSIYSIDLAKTERVDEIVEALGSDLAADGRTIALSRLKELRSATASFGRGISPLVRVLTQSNLRAFLHGVMLRSPELKFTTKSGWTALGMAAGLYLLIPVGIFLARGALSAITLYIPSISVIAVLAIWGAYVLAILTYVRAIWPAVIEHSFVGVCMVTPLIIVVGTLVVFAAQGILSAILSKIIGTSIVEPQTSLAIAFICSLAWTVWLLASTMHSLNRPN